MGTGRDTRTRRRTLPRAAHPEGRERSPCLCQPEMCLETLPQWGGGGSGGQTNPFPYSQGTRQAVGMSPSPWQCFVTRSTPEEPVAIFAFTTTVPFFFFFYYTEFCSPKVGHSHSTCLLQSSIISCCWPGSGIVVLGALWPGAALPGAPGLWMQ